MIHSEYLSKLFDMDSFAGVIRAATSRLQDREFDAIAVTGNSGAIVGGALALALHKGLILVRKPDDHSHARRLVEGDDTYETYIFVDDMVCSGETRGRVRRAIGEAFPDMMYIGTYEYNSDWFSGPL